MIKRTLYFGNPTYLNTHADQLQWQLLADNSKANQLFNWQPKKKGIEGFKSGLELTIKWFSNPENLTSFKTDTYNK